MGDACPKAAGIPQLGMDRYGSRPSSALVTHAGQGRRHIERHQLRTPCRHVLQLSKGRQHAGTKGLDAAALAHHAKLHSVPGDRERGQER